MALALSVAVTNGMIIGIIVQARMSSMRLPGKVLRPLLGKPMMQYTLERLERARSIDRLVVATSVEPSDDPVEKFCKTYGAECYRGPLNNVSQRFVDVIGLCHLDVFVRVCADSPFMDQAIVDQAVEIFRKGKFDMVTNTLTRSFPKGQSVEVVDAEVFRAAYARMKGSDDFEHVTRYFHAHNDEFRIHNFSAKDDNSGVQLSVDTPEDFQIAGKIIDAMDRPHWQHGFNDILKLRQQVSPV